MPNPIKYSTGSETLALKKGNFYIGTGDVGKGPSDSTGYYQGPSPASGGYVIYLNKSGVPGNLSYHSAANDAQLIAFTNNLAGTSFTSATQCLNYYATQTDKVCFNRDYEGIVTSGLTFNLDAGFTPSYSRSGTTWYDVYGSNNGTLTNGPTYNSTNGGSIVFDGVDDFVTIAGPNQGPLSTIGAGEFTICVWASNTRIGGDWGWFLSNWSTTGMHMGRHANGGTLGGYFGDNSDLRTNYIIPTDGSWHFYVATRQSTTIKYYVDSVEYPITSGNPTDKGNSIGSGTNTRIGSRGDSTSQLWLGNVGIELIYNRLLSTSEILQNYNATKGRFGL